MKRKGEWDVRALYEHKDFLRGLAKAIVSDEDLADEVVQQTYIQAWRTPPRDARNLRGWLARVARNFALMSLRTRARRTQHESNAPRRPQVRPLDEVLAERENRRELVQWVESLDEPLRSALLMRYFDSLGYREIAARQGVNPETARSRVRYALRRLREDVRQRRAPLVSPSIGLLVPFWPLSWRRLRKPALAFAGLAALVALSVVVWFAAGARSEAVHAPRHPGAREAASAAAAGSASEVVAAGDDDDPNRVAGREVVVNGVVSADGIVVPGIRVRVLRAYEEAERAGTRLTRPLAATRTGPDGRFRLRLARRTRLTLALDPDDRAAVRHLVVVPPEGDPPEQRIHLVPSSIVRVRVRDEEQRPLAGVRVRARMGSGVTAPIERWVTTDVEGRGELRLPEPDWMRPLLLTLERPGYPTMTRDCAPAFDVNRGAVMEYELVARGGGTLRGCVRDADGEPVAGARVEATVQLEGRVWYRGVATADAGGRYEIARLPPCGIRRLAVSAPGGLAHEFDAGDVRIVRDEVTRFDLRLESGQPIEGTALGPGDAPVAEATVSLFVHRGEALERLARTAADGDGRFVFGSVPRGRYALEARAPGLVRRVVRRRGSELPVAQELTHDLTVAGVRPPPLRLRLVSAGDVLLHFDPPRGSPGRLPEEQALVPAWVLAGGVLHQCHVDPAGVGRLDGVPATDAAFAYGPGDPAGPFRIEPGKTASVRLAPRRHAALFDVLVLDPTGAPVHGAALGVFPVGAPLEWVRKIEWQYDLAHDTMRTDRAGRARLAVPARLGRELEGGWRLVAHAPGHARGEVTGARLRSGASPWTVRLGRGLAIAGRVVGAGPGEFVLVGWRRLGGTPAFKYDATARRDGSFEIRGLLPGRYLVRALTDRFDSEPVRATAPADDVVVRMNAQPLERLAGQVTDEAGTAIDGAAVTATGADGLIHYALTGRNGVWMMRLPAGEYDLRVAPNAGSADFRARALGRHVTGTVGLATRVETRPMAYAGNVRGRAGRPGAGALVVPRPGPGRAFDESFVMPYQIVDDSGRFRFPTLPADYTEFLVVADRHVPRVVTLGEPDLDLWIDLVPHEPIAGVLEQPDGRPAAGVMLRLVPADEQARADEALWTDRRNGTTQELIDGWLRRTLTTDEEGRFAFGQIGTGAYAIVVVDSPYGWKLTASPVAAGVASRRFRLEESAPADASLRRVARRDSRR